MGCNTGTTHLMNFDMDFSRILILSNILGESYKEYSQCLLVQLDV